MTVSRDHELEGVLNATLSAGDSVWVIGDVHGHHKTLVELLKRLDYNVSDHLLFIGDLIDSGPASARIVDLVRRSDNMHCILGNHERMMIDGFRDLKQGRHSFEFLRWRKYGGGETYDSYKEVYRRESDEAMNDACSWFESLPLEVVLDRYRMVHAGYDPLRGVDNLDESAALWYRQQYHDHPEPLDPDRQVIFGHTPTQKLAYMGGVSGQVMYSPWKLADGRSAWVGIDTGIKAGKGGVLTAFGLHDESVVQVEFIP